MNDDVKEKQEFLRIHILDKGYDADEFMKFLETLKGENGLKIENWSKNDLIQAVEQFTRKNPKPNNENNEVNNVIIQNQILDQEFLQCRLTERNGISAEKNLIIKVSDPKVIEGNFFSKSYVTYLVETKPVGFIVRRRFNDFIWLHDILKQLYINCVIPPLSKKNYIYGIKDYQIAKRIRVLQKFMTEISVHPLLKHSQIFYEFITIKEDKDFIKKKDEYSKINFPKKAEDIKTLSGELNITINYDKEQYAEKNIKMKEDNNLDNKELMNNNSEEEEDEGDFNLDNLTEEEKMALLQQREILMKLQEEAEARGEHFDIQEYLAQLAEQSEEDDEYGQQENKSDNKLNKSF